MLSKKRQRTATDAITCPPIIYMVGVFPPPVHGMAVLNASMYRRLCERGSSPIVLNLSPAALTRSWFNRLGRIPKVATALFRYIRGAVGGRGGVLYIGVSGGWGQLYEALFVLAGRLHGAKVYLHHHSFAYLDRQSLPARVLMRLAGSATTHITLCPGQSQKLRQRYPQVLQTRVVSNAAVIGLDLRSKPRTRTRAQKLGFLSNISREKGIVELIAVAKELERQNGGFEIYVAGPFDNESTAQLVQKTGRELQTLHYVGALYSEQKEAFWEMIDVFLLPSKYRNETAPVVVYEAMAHGIPVIAWERGCLSDMISAGSGLLIDRNEDFSSNAVQQVLGWKHDPATFATASNAAANSFQEQSEKHECNLASLLDEICLGVGSREMAVGTASRS